MKTERVEIYARGEAPFSLITDNDIFYLASTVYEHIDEDGLSFGYPADSGTFEICTYKRVEIDEIRETWNKSQSFIEPNDRYDPRYCRFLDWDDYDDEENFVYLISEEERRCREAIFDGAEKIHQFGNGDILSALDDLYFVYRKASGNFPESYHILTPNKNNGFNSVENAIKAAIDEDVMRTEAKEARDAFNKSIQACRSTEHR